MMAPRQDVLRRGEIPKLARGERYCIPCRRIVRVGFADNGEHSNSAAHMAALGLLPKLESREDLRLSGSPEMSGVSAGEKEGLAAGGDR